MEDVIQIVSLVQHSVTYLNGVTQNTKLNTNYKNDDHFKHLKKIRIINNKHNDYIH